MSYLQVRDLSKSYGQKILFENIFFSIDKGDKVAFIAKNGSGKSTLINTIMGLTDPDHGEIQLAEKIKISFLNQEPKLNNEHTIIESIFSSENSIIQAVKKYNEALLNPEDAIKIHASIEEMDKFAAWDFENKVKNILSTLKIDHITTKIGMLSGGEKKRLALAKVLIEEPDFIILDEPTNHLDIEMVEWLEEFLNKSNMTILMVTHDRYFLDKICNKIIELDKSKIYEYRGNYSYFLEKKASRIEMENHEIEAAKNMYIKELYWMKRQPQARQTKSKARIDNFYEVKEIAHQKTEEKQMQLDLIGSRIGNKILEIHNVCKTNGEKEILKNFSYKFRNRDRIGIIGRNGIGKSTFLNLITEKQIPDNGKIIKGETIKIGYYCQEGTLLNENHTVLEAISEISDFIPLSNGKKISASKMLERFLFDNDTQYNLISKLSGGEKKRLNLLKVLMENPNFLILDEPTNDLDIVTLNILEDFLDEFKGCLVIVSHDRSFMDRLVEHLFVFKGNGLIEDYPGNYSDYRYQKELDKIEFKEIKEEKKSQENKFKLTPSEKQEIKKLEREIEKLETQKSQLTNDLNLSNDDYKKAIELSKEIEIIINEIDKKTQRWMELSEKS